MALLAHVLQPVAWWLAPLVILLIKRESKFTTFHALQALLLQVVYLFVIGVFVVLWFSVFFIMIAHAPAAKNAPPPLAFFILMPVIWLGLIGAWAVLLVMAIVYGVKAGRGEWAAYPVLGSVARRILKITPGGESLPA
jgi:uncharacterized membrane protein